MGRTEQSFVKGRNPNGQKTHEEILTIPDHKGNANQNHIKIPPHSCKNGYHKEHKKQMLVMMWRQRNLHTLLVGM
jgi:hypothetical protein